MDLNEAQRLLSNGVREVTEAFQKVPGSAVIIRYVQSSYQNDPIRSAIELVLVLFFIRYLLSPSYPTHKQSFIKLREDVGSDLSIIPLSPCLPGSLVPWFLAKSRLARKSTSWLMSGSQSRWFRRKRALRRQKARSCRSLSGECSADGP
jgi:hypothetical protein